VRDNSESRQAVAKTGATTTEAIKTNRSTFPVRDSCDSTYSE
jgi:hypothetical protein